MLQRRLLGLFLVATVGSCAAESSHDTGSIPEPPTDIPPIPPAPMVSITAPAEGATLSGPVEIELGAKELGASVSAVRFELPGGVEVTDAEAPFGLSWDSTTAPNGAQIITVIALHDSAEIARGAVRVAVDNTLIALPPTISFTAPAAGASVIGDVVVTATAAATTGTLAAVRFDLPDGTSITDAVAPYETTWRSITVGNGAHAVRATAIDGGGRTATSSVSITVANPAPTFRILSPAEGATVSGSKLVLGSATDSAKVVSVRFELPDGTTVTDTTDPFSFTWNTTRTPDGMRTLRAVVTEVGGGTVIVTRTVKVANGVNFLPTVRFTAPTPGSNNAGMVTITADAADPEGSLTSVRFALPDGTSVTDTAAPYSVVWNSAAMPNAARTVTATATDAAGATATATVTFNVYNGGRNYAPYVTITDPDPNHLVVSGVHTITVDATDYDGSVVWVRFDLPNGTAVYDRTPPYSIAWDTATGPLDAERLSVAAMDNLGAMNQYSRDVRIENTSSALHPVVEAIYPNELDQVHGIVNLRVNAWDFDGSIRFVEFWGPGGAHDIVDAPPFVLRWDTRSVHDGPAVLDLLATDNDGHVTQRTLPVQIANESIGPCANTTVAATAGLPLTIPDNTPAGVSSSIDLTGAGTVASLALSLRIRHHTPRDLVVTLTSPSGTSHDLWYRRSTPSGQDLTLVEFPVPAFDGQRVDGTWRLTVSDESVYFSGVLDAWSLKVLGACDRMPPRASSFAYGWVERLPYNPTVDHHIIVPLNSKVTVGTCGMAGASFTGDTRIEVHDRNGFTLASSYDACGGLGSQLTMIADRTGDLDLAARCTGLVPCSGTVAWTVEGTFPFTADDTSDGRYNTVNRDLPLVAGQRLSFGTCGMPGASFSGDTWIRVADPSGHVVTSSSDACGDAGSKGAFVAPATGTYQLRLGCRESTQCSGTAAWKIE
jgi:subtilisin-like proprotein convertase family protein